MKYTLILFSLCCLMTTGCQSGSMSSRWANLFGPKESQHTLAQSNNAQKGSKSASPSSQLLAGDDFRKGEAALQSGNLKQAKKHFMAVVTAEPDNASAHHRLAYIADKNEEYNTAEIHYLTAMRIDPQNADIPCDLGYSYMLQNRDKDSRRYLEKALLIDPRHKSSLLNLATVQARQGDYQGSLALFRQAGSEQEAQANIARLFPNGPPAGGNDIQLASNENRQPPNEATLELQRKLANARNNERAEGLQAFQELPVAQNPKQNPQPGRTQQPDYSKMNPREIPAGSINDAFAQIDDEYEQQRLQKHDTPNSSPAPKNRPTNTAPMSDPRAYVVENSRNRMPDHQAVVAPDPYVNTTPPANSPSRQPTNGQNQYASNSSLPPMNLETPRDPVPPQKPAAVPIDLSEYAVVGLPEESSDSEMEFPAPFPNSTPVPSQTASAEPPAMSPPANLPTGNPQGNIYQPAAASRNIPNRPEQNAMQLALQMGMNAGPGQMFPMPSGKVPSSAPVASKPPYQPGHQRLNIQTTPDANSLLMEFANSNPNAGIPSPTPDVQFGNYQQPIPGTEKEKPYEQVSGLNPNGNNNPPAPENNTIPNWPHNHFADQAQTPTQNTEAHSTQKQNLPWLDSADQTPTPEPGTNSAPVEPQQWPYAPGASTSNAQGVIIQRGTQPQNSQQNQSHNSSMPNVNPATY
ncbi:MAG: hypothetical protein CMN21_06080 [Rubinisphaera sp.]|uniref:tetratricopeptide repeat protein n=1 Tax=Rubinisphaera sp. TaxID=2024857 RepID=UPI000C0E9BD8|nr:tetratricopeptide repeat protein [Rubinisphaera sp.]MBV08775.1 hypothetical protein [Rubinisphaera sp.]